MGAKQYAYINGEMLKWARSITSYDNPCDVEANIKGITPMKLLVWESGEEYPSITEAKKLAKLYKVPFASFYLSDPPKEEIKPYEDRRTISGTTYNETSYALWSEIRRIVSNRETLLEYVSTADEDIPPIPLISDTDSIQKTATILRNFLEFNPPFKFKKSYQNNAFNYFRNIFEHHGIIVAQISKVPLSEMKGLSIYYEPCSIIAVNSKDFERAKVFSLFHELAHLARRSSSLCLINFDERNDEEEKICDRIAAEVLMPEDSFHKIVEGVLNTHNEWSLSHLQKTGDKFATSSFSVLIRLKELEIISKDKYNSLYKDLNSEFEREQKKIDEEVEKRSPRIPYYVKYLNQQGYLFPRLILNAHARGEITYGEMCKFLNIGRKHITDIEHAVMFT
jgi:Zn-dependent peptidase ImmA (M78 family)